MYGFLRLLRLLPFVLVVAAIVLAAACGDDDDARPTPKPTVAITAEDETALDKMVTDVIAALQQRTRTALDPLAGEALVQRPEQLDRLATCFPEGGSLEVRNREIKPGTENDVRLTINFTVTQNGAVTNVRKDWRFERQADGAFKLSDAPDCPFSRSVPSADVETTAPEAETPVDGEVPEESEEGAPVE